MAMATSKTEAVPVSAQGPEEGSQLAVYLYGVGHRWLEAPTDVEGVAPSTGDCRVISDGALGALVTVVPSRPPVTSRNVVGHERVVDAAARAGGFVPARFGVVAEDADAVVTDLLETSRAALTKSLELLSGRVELRLTVTHEGDELLREAIEQSPRLAQLSRRVRARPSAATYYDRITLGEAARDEVVRLQHRDLDALQGRLAPLVAGQKVLAGPDGASTRVAYLVGCDDLERFDEALEEYAASREGKVRLELLGPLAPWDFVDLGVEGAVGAAASRRDPRLTEQAAR
jgi:hypothetical protein